MSDIAFRCLTCGHDLAAPAQSEGRVINCPNCQSSLTIPTVSVEVYCPSCGLSVRASEEMRGAVYACPECDADIAIPALTGSPAAADATLATAQPPSSTGVEFRSIVQPAARATLRLLKIMGHELFSVLKSAGSFLYGRIRRQPPASIAPPTGSPAPAANSPPRTNPTHTPFLPGITGESPHQHPPLRLRPAEFTHTFRSPLIANPHGRRNKHSAPWPASVRFSAWLAAALIVLTAIFCFVDLGRADLTRGWQRAAATLDRLDARPSDANALHNLGATLNALGAAGADDQDLAGLLSVYGFGSLMAGETQAGSAALKRLQQAAPNSSYVALLAGAQSTQDCSTCGGSGHSACERCKGSGQCTFCDGSGKAPTLKGPAQRKLLNCTSCKGSGTCRACAGNPNNGALCSRCAGKGQIAASGNLQTQFATALETARKDTTGRLRYADVLNRLRNLQTHLLSFVSGNPAPASLPATTTVFAEDHS